MIRQSCADLNRPSLPKSRWGGIGIGLIALLLASCQTVSVGTLPPEKRPAPIYSGYFIWDSERQYGNMAVQCMQLVFDREEAQADGQIRLHGVTRYVTGPEDEVNFVETEMLYDPDAGTFTLWESNPTSDSFVTDGSYIGRFNNGTMFLEATWHGNEGPESGRIVLRQGDDAPCLMEQDA